ncbi:hypothetical protein D3C78_1052920 [compost metagenome]
MVDDDKGQVRQQHREHFAAADGFRVAHFAEHRQGVFRDRLGEVAKIIVQRGGFAAVDIDLLGFGFCALGAFLLLVQGGHGNSVRFLLGLRGNGVGRRHVVGLKGR